MDAMGRGGYDELLVDAVLPLAPGLGERLAASGLAADVACGTGHTLVVLGKAFSASTFVGYDLDEEAIGRARREAAAEGLADVAFEVGDVAQLQVERPFDVVFMFDALHDQVDPVGVLGRIHAALVPGGTFLLKEPRVSSNLEDNMGDPDHAARVLDQHPALPHGLTRPRRRRARHRLRRASGSSTPHRSRLR